MPMTARCGAAALCRGATTVRVAAHEASGGKSTERVQLQLHARVWTKTQLHRHARVWTKTQGRGRKLVAIQTVALELPVADLPKCYRDPPLPKFLRGPTDARQKSGTHG